MATQTVVREGGEHHIRRPDAVGSVLVVAWSAALTVLLLGPALAPGLVLSYDMVWVPDLTLRPDFWGLASGLPRAVPSDAVVSVLDQPFGGVVLQKVVLAGSFLGGGLGADLLVRRHLGVGRTGRLAAVTAYQWNAYVAERLLLGHWTMLVCYAVLPWLMHAALQGRRTRRWPGVLLVLVPLGSLSASAGLVTAVALLAASAGRDLRRMTAACALLVAGNAPWVTAGLLHAGASGTDPSGASLFALGDEGSVPGPLAALSLGGVWNREVVPESRTGPLGWLALALLVVIVAAGLGSWWAALGRRDGRSLAACWLIGYAVALLGWLWPEAVAAIGENVPGGGLLRDGSRLLALAGPTVATVVAAGADRLAGSMREAVPRAMVVGGVVVLPVLLMSDAAWGLRGQLRAVDLPEDYALARQAVAAAPAGDTLVLPLSSYRLPSWNHGLKVLDPLGRSQPRDFLASDVLVVSGTGVPGEDPRVKEAAEALAAQTGEERARRLAALGFGAVAIDREAPGDAPEVAGEVLYDGQLIDVVGIPGARAASAPTSWRVAMVVAWTAYAGLVVAAALLAVVRLAGPVAGGRLRPRAGRDGGTSGGGGAR